MAHRTEAVVATCIDFRFQEFIENWLHENVGIGKYDRISLAGGVKDLPNVMEQLSVSVRLHNVRTAILMNHEDCGAYGPEGTHDKHVQDLIHARNTVNQNYPNLNVDLYYIHLDGTFEQISS